MITNFEEITAELTEPELCLLGSLIKGFNAHNETNPIKAPEIVRMMNVHAMQEGINVRMTEPRLRKIVNYIRSKGLIPLIATSDGYFVSHNPEVIRSQIKSLMERSNSIKRCADGLSTFINK